MRQDSSVRTQSATNPLVEKLARRDMLSDAEKHALAQVLSPPRHVAIGTDLIKEGERPEHSTLLVEGLCARYSNLSDGGRQITELCVAGDFMDLHSFVMKQMDHGVVALTDCRIATAPHAALRDLTRTQPHLTRLLWLDTVIDGAIHRQWLVAMGRRSGLSQLAHLLCELYLRLEVVGEAEAHHFALPLTQIQLADVLGLSAVHVNRLIAELRDKGLVFWRSQTVTLADWNGLVALAEFDPTYLRLHSDPV